MEESRGLYWDIAQYCTALLCLFVCSVWVLNTGYSALLPVSACSRQLSSDNVCLGWETRGRGVCTVVSPVLGTGCGAGCRDRTSLQSPTVSLLYSPQGGGGARHHSGQTVTWSPACSGASSHSRLLSQLLTDPDSPSIVSTDSHFTPNWPGWRLPGWWREFCWTVTGVEPGIH